MSGNFIDLKRMWATGSGSQLTVVSACGREFKANHMVVGSYSSRMDELVLAANNGEKFITTNNRLALPESDTVVERMLQWMYTVEWSDVDAPVDIGTEVVTLKDVCKAGEKYELRPLYDLALACAGTLIEKLTHYKQCIQLMKELTAGAIEGNLMAKCTQHLERLIEKHAAVQKAPPEATPQSSPSQKTFRTVAEPPGASFEREKRALKRLQIDSNEQRQESGEEDVYRFRGAVYAVRP